MKYLKVLSLAAIAAVVLTAFLGAAGASAAGLYAGHTKLKVGDTLAASLKTGTSALLKDTGGSTNDTCTGSAVHGTISNAGGAGVNVAGNLSALPQGLSFSGCSHKTTVIAGGSLEVSHITGTTDGTVTSKNAEVTVQSTVFGISCIAKTGAGTDIGKLKGITTGHATMEINGVINMGAFCGDSTWTGTYIVTSPTGLNVEAS